MEIYNKGTLKITEINLKSFISMLEVAKKTNNLIEENTSEWNNYLRNYKIDLEFVSDIFCKIKPKGEERELKNYTYKSYTPELVFIKKDRIMGFYFFSKDIGKAYSYEGHKQIKLDPLINTSLSNNFPTSDIVSNAFENMEIFTNGTSSTFIEINSNSFMSALDLATKNNSRIRTKDPLFIKYLNDLDVDTTFVKEFIKKIPNSKLTIIIKGLMSGFYIYSFDVKKVFYYFNNTKKLKIKPLRKYSLTDNMPVYDFVISYSKNDNNLTRDLYQILSFNFKVFFIDIETVKEDPIWQMRYREAMYHSHYFIPIFSNNYLTTKGALSEFFESIYLNIDFRTITFYNYFIPFILGDLTFEKIKSLIEISNNEYPQEFNYDTKLFFNILNDINFGLILENYSFKEIVIFLKSILTNNKEILNNNTNTLSDYGFLKVLLMKTDFVIYSNLSESQFGDEKFPELNVVTLFINKSTSYWNIIDILSDGRCINRQFTTEIQNDAIKVNEKTLIHITKFLDSGVE